MEKDYLLKVFLSMFIRVIESYRVCPVVAYISLQHNCGTQLTYVSGIAVNFFLQKMLSDNFLWRGITAQHQSIHLIYYT